MGFDLSTGDDVRSVSLRSGLRGYDKSDVDGFRAAVADLVDDLRRRLDAASGHLAQLGLEDPLDLKEEFASVGKEVTAILEAARTAATDIRERASADGEEWRAEASADAERMRTEAWQEASAHLDSAVAEAQQTRASADEDALFIRAQAEKEAIRLTSEAKRDADELVRNARAEADSIIAGARQAAEAAQERTRALEVRREELMSELEEARRAIGVVEAQIEEQHQRLMAPDTTTVRIIDQGPEEPATEAEAWLDDDTTVRLVPAESRTSMTDLEPVLDADDIVAEVERLQIEPSESAVSDEAPVESPLAETESTATAITEPEVDDPWGSEAAQPSEPSEAAVAPEAVRPDPAPEDDGSLRDRPHEADDDEAETVDIEEQPPELSAEITAGPGDAADGLADLFASLRTPAPAATDTQASAAETARDADPAVETRSQQLEPVFESPPASSVVEETRPMASDDDPALERESILLPITNRALRTVKKQILEFQNVMLEATKADPDDWRPDQEEYRLALDPHVQAMVDEAHRAAGGEGGSGVAVEFGAALATAVIGSAETMSGSGYRETSASLGRIYRSWRSDEAERRLTDLAAAAYEAATTARNPS
jgi:cell division septum initiation protein DivIVA